MLRNRLEINVALVGGPSRVAPKEAYLKSTEYLDKEQRTPSAVGMAPFPKYGVLQEIEENHCSLAKARIYNPCRVLKLNIILTQ